MLKQSYVVEELSSMIAEKALIKRPHQRISHLLTDSRKVSDPASSIFFTLKGRRDAHQFIPALYEQGLRCFVITDINFDVNLYPDANFLWVKDSLRALQLLAKQHRKNFQMPVIAITGSNGKTIIKEWLFQLLVADYKIVRSPKSYNSQVGVPLSVWQMNDLYDLAIFEAGISTTYEMEHLEAIIQPTIGILTNIGAAHDEGFANRAEKLAEKLRLFQHCKTVIIPKKYLDDSLRKKDVFTWSREDKADLQITAVHAHQQDTHLQAIYQHQEISITIPFTDKASIENAIICWATLLKMGLAQQIIQQRMERLLAVKMRLELKSGIHQSSIIDDSYNSDFSSLEIALDFLNQQKQHPTKTLILSDIHQTGIPSQELYPQLAALLTNKGIDKLIGIGDELYQYQNLFTLKSWFYKDTDTFLEEFDKQQFRNEIILIKGARHFEFEKISQALTQKVHDTVLEINLNALEFNLNHYKAKLKPGVKLMAMVKAFAYGSGSDEVANLLQHNRVDYLAVAYTDEGIALRQAGIHLPIMVLSPEVPSFEAILQYQLEPELYNFRILKAFADFLKEEKKQDYPVHLKLDTGMHRLGFDENEVPALCEYLKTQTELKVRSVLSHLAASESEEHRDYTQYQIQLFQKLSQQIKESLSYDFIRHIANTSAISRWPDAQFEMVRLGIGLYGIASVAEEQAGLQNVATLKTTITQIKHLKKGDTIGYGRRGVMLEDGKIATVKIGYADGYPRALGNGVGKMMINQQLAPTIGSICMDMCMLDVTGLEVKEEDDVIVFNEELSVYDLAKQLKTIPYEVLTNISQRVKRVYFYE
ncbi:MAG: bifunctional UDP-N-acetylmuramoyl-tripeptide:D-alanyl-D-alanine ligase/alanine racemase [Sphingobacteriales bacterium]|nr:bifunctional UDP-N-acetylmuramoyl-tripeptide:D-alanyl-D-alanine ligase/alanine racemase [Sphingobacteriales bacterium]